MIDILSKFTYITELLLAELIFLYPFPKRKHFCVRYIAAILINEIVWGILFFYLNLPRNLIFSFVEMLAKIVFTILTMWLCFDSSIWAIGSACVGGVALQHIGYQTSVLISRVVLQTSWNIYFEMGACAVLFVIFLILFGIPLARHHYYENYDKRMIVLSVLIVFVCIGIIRLFRGYVQEESKIVLCICTYSITCNVLALFIQFFWCHSVMLKSENLVLRQINESEKIRYENSKTNIDLINIKCHDLKHKLVALEDQLPKEEIESMRKLVDAYDSTYKTGLDVLDVILNEKNIRCMSKGISLTCMGDGKVLSFMSTMDLYSLFGNMLENAIEATERLSDPEQKHVSIVIEKKGEMVYINSINFTDQAYLFEDGLPKTTKQREDGYHGYGLKSIRMIAEKYQGGITIAAEDGVFALGIYMLPSE
ncbi:MAG: sensor histidine kinase [Clostridia bacterium]|nr:sensor histidine kinase [Clostridia bacterium]